MPIPEASAPHNYAISAQSRGIQGKCIRRPASALRELLRIAKRELTALLLAERAPAIWRPEDWHAHYSERAAALEHDCGLTRAQAETTALQDCLHLYAGRRPK